MSTAAIKKCLKDARAAGNDFWVGEENIQTGINTKSKTSHIIASGNTSFCNATINDFTTSAYIDLYLETTICSVCRSFFYFTAATGKISCLGYESMLKLAAYAYMVVAEIETFNPPAYSELWHEAARILPILHLSKEEGQFLMHAREKAIETLEKYLDENPARLEDLEFKNYIQTYLEESSYPESMERLLEWQKGLQREKPQNLHVLYSILNAKTNYNTEALVQMTKEELQELLAEEIKLLKRVAERKLAEIPAIIKSLDKSPLHLIQITKTGPGSSASVHSVLYALPSVKTLEDRGVLAPEALIKAFKERGAWPYKILDLGKVEETDTKEILETTLALSLPSDKALAAARLLCE